MTQKPLCFVLMPFGKKQDPSGGPEINFDTIYYKAIKPAIEEAEMEPIRADEEALGGIIHEAMFARLLFCEYAVADLTSANANVFYELGVRHTAKPHTTVTIFGERQRIPFDINFLRSMPYSLGKKNNFGDTEAVTLKNMLRDKLIELRGFNKEDENPPVDSPLFNLIENWPEHKIPQIENNTFRDQILKTNNQKQEIVTIRDQGEKADPIEGLKTFQAGLGELDAVDVSIIVELLVAYRALNAWQEMIDLVEALPASTQNQTLVQEKLGFAYNRNAKLKEGDERTSKRKKALEILTKVISTQGANPETLGLIGRIHKDNWDETRESDPIISKGHLKKAIDAYVQGFETDHRDAYPGINAVTLLDIKGDADSLKQKEKLLPVVHFAVERRLESETPDYWDYATMLELAVLGDDYDLANDYLSSALTIDEQPEAWQLETTNNNLKLLRDSRAEREAETDTLSQIIEYLEGKIEEKNK